MTRTRLVVNFVAFQAAWFGAVGGAAAGRDWLGPVATAAVVTGHLATVRQPWRELSVLVAVGLLGATWDSTLVALGLIEYRGTALAPGAATLWIAALWVAFATTLNGSLAWLQGRPVLAALLGAVFAPLAYAAGESMGAVRFVEPVAALAAQAGGWAVLLPVACVLAARAARGDLPEARRV